MRPHRPEPVPTRKHLSECHQERAQANWFALTRKLIKVHAKPFTLLLPVCWESNTTPETCDHPAEMITNGANQYGSWTKCRKCLKKLSYKKYGADNPPPSREEDCEGQDGNGVCDTSNAKAESSQELSQRELRSDSRGASEGSGDAATASGCHHGTDHDSGNGPARAELPGHAGDPGLLGDGTAESSTSSSCRANAVATDTSSSRSEVGAPARSGYRDDQPESRSGPGLVPCLATLSMSSLGERFVSPSSTGERASWLVSPLRSSSFNCFSMVNPSDVYVCQGEGDFRLSVVWRDRQLIQDLIMGDANDDH